MVVVFQFIYFPAFVGFISEFCTFKYHSCFEEKTFGIKE